MLKSKSFSLYIKASIYFLFLSFYFDFCLILSLTCLKKCNQFIETLTEAMSIIQYTVNHDYLKIKLSKIKHYVTQRLLLFSDSTTRNKNYSTIILSWPTRVAYVLRSWIFHEAGTPAKWSVFIGIQQARVE